MTAMNHLRGGVVRRLRKPVAALALTSGLISGALVFGGAASAGGAVAFSGPQPLPVELQQVVDIAIAAVEAVPSYVSSAVADATSLTSQYEAQLQQLLGGL